MADLQSDHSFICILADAQAHVGLQELKNQFWPNSTQQKHNAQ